MSAILAHEIEGDGEPLLLVNGGLMTYAAWEPLVERLRDGHRLLRCDLRGQLLSPGAPPAELADNVADLTALLDHLGIGATHVLGTSYGGAVAVLLTALAPARVRSLVAVTVADHSDAAMRSESEEWRRLLAAAEDATGRERFHRRLMEAVYSDGFRARHEAELTMRRAQVAMLPEIWWRALVGIFDAVATLDLRPHLAAIEVPAMVIAAAEDRLIPLARALALAAAIPGAETRVHETSGHALVAEDPAWLADVVRDFLGRHAARAGSGSR